MGNFLCTALLSSHMTPGKPKIAPNIFIVVGLKPASWLFTATNSRSRSFSGTGTRDSVYSSIGTVLTCLPHNTDIKVPVNPSLYINNRLDSSVSVFCYSSNFFYLLSFRVVRKSRCKLKAIHYPRLPYIRSICSPLSMIDPGILL